MKSTDIPHVLAGRTICRALLLWLVSVPVLHAAASGNDEQLSYVASYRGLLSAGLRVDIAAVGLTLPSLAGVDQEQPGEAMLTFTTKGFRKVEMLLPMRFCYRSRLALTRFATQEVDWWSRIGSKISRGRLDFAAQRQRVIRRHVERKLTTQGASDYALERRLSASSWANDPDPDYSEAAFPFRQSPPMDQLTMVQWLRHQPLTPGMVLDPAVSDGHQLRGFHIEVKGEDTTPWDDRLVPSLRIRLQPRFGDATNKPPTWLWLSRDARRLPLLFRSSRLFGSFEVRLVSAAGRPQLCSIPETTELELPKY